MQYTNGSAALAAPQTYSGERSRLSVLEYVLLVYLSFFPANLISNFVSRDLAVYVFSDYAALYVLLAWLLLTMAKRQALKMPIYIFGYVGIVIAIEYYHVLRLGAGLAGNTGIRAIVYNPLYSNFFNLILFYLILKVEGARRLELARGFVLITVAFAVLYILLWPLVYLDVLVLSGSDKPGFLNNNTASYIACLVVFILGVLRQRLGLSNRALVLCIATCVALALINTTRGAMLILFLYVILHLYFNSRSKPRFVMVAFIVCMVPAMTLANIVDWKGYAELAARVHEQLVKDAAFESSGSRIFDDRPEEYAQAGDEQISAISRIATNYYALVVFLANAWIGIGSASGYALKIFGEGVHSLLFLFPLAVGAVGTIAALLLFRRFSSGNSWATFNLVFYFLAVSCFLNKFLLWYAFLFFLRRGPRDRVNRRFS
jgi:hypothetical protein